MRFDPLYEANQAIVDPRHQRWPATNNALNHEVDLTFDIQKVDQ